METVILIFIPKYNFKIFRKNEKKKITEKFIVSAILPTSLHVFVLSLPPMYDIGNLCNK